MESGLIAAKLFLQEACVLGEGPLWFDGRLWWVDIEQGFLLAHQAGRPVVRWPLGQRSGVAVPVDRNTFVVALERSIVLLDIPSGKLTPLCEEAPIPEGHRFNDGKCDPAGRFIVGTLDMGGERGTDALYIYEKGKPLRLLREGLSISNGLAWSQDGGTFYHIDTPARTVSAFDYDVRNGTVSGERTVFAFSERDGWPDGMTIDREGRLWIAFWDGWAVRCYRPGHEKCVAEIQVPCSRPSSCCFGGPELDQLYITTARYGLDAEELLRQPLAGSVFVCNPGTNGFPSFLFI